MSPLTPSSHNRTLANQSQELTLTRTSEVVARREILFENITIYSSY
jgi:hypothetical protein